VRDAVCVAFGAAALATSVLAVGGVLRFTQAVVAMLVALALAAQFLASRKLDRISPLVALIGAAALLTALQLVPLPASWLEALNSTGSQLREDGAVLADTWPWEAISLDPAATLRQLAFFVILLGVALVSLRYAVSERGRFALLAGVAIVCGVAALVTGIHTLVNADSLYSLYEPRYATGGIVFGPLLNPNHLGGLMAIGVVLAVGLSFYHRQRTQLRVLWVVIAIACTIVCAASFSRGAVIGMVIGLAFTGGLLIAGRFTTPKLKRRSWRNSNSVPMLGVIAVGVAVALYFSAGTVVDQLENTSVNELDRPTSKYAAWRSSMTLLEESPLFGIGRGATESTLTRVHPASGRATFSHL
jgi:O-antigen ligase